jgi:hypothetical protein
LLRERASRQAAGSGITPLEYVLGIMRDEDQPLKVRMAAAKIALPFCHPRLAAEHITTDEPKPHEDWLASLLDEGEEDLQPA